MVVIAETTGDKQVVSKRSEDASKSPFFVTGPQQACRPREMIISFPRCTFDVLEKLFEQRDYLMYLIWLTRVSVNRCSLFVTPVKIAC